ncbi:hypothetical protein [Cellulomonas sp.]|uniref:hypothetical protein n=1 Tax=Cellulomonas sp. TaxID=40001 RepID=UPI001B236088|nr:hypothetical protein [Cellulomonas sp.]MBO9556340.1 hypothetical protein [Cellulomonas sp.]
MTDDLSVALRGFAESERRAAVESAPDPTGESTMLARRVTRRRTVRAGATALVAVVAVAGLAAGVQAVRRPEPAVPPPTPVTTSSVTPSPSPVEPTPTATPTSTPTNAAPASFDSAPPMPPGMLAESDEGWTLVRFESWATDESVLEHARVYLVDPDGRVFVVPSATDPASWYVLDWLPGTSSVLVESTTLSETWVLDLLSGEAGPVLERGAQTPTYVEEARFAHDGTDDLLLVRASDIVRAAPDGTVLATMPRPATHEGATALLVDGTGTRAAVNDVTGVRAVRTDDLSAAPLPLPDPRRPGACRAWSWVGDDVLQECTTGAADDFQIGAPSEFWLVPVDGGQPRAVPAMPEATRLGGVWLVGDRLVAGTFGPTESEAAWWDVGGATPTPLGAGGPQQIRVVAVQDGRLLTVEQPYSLHGPVVSALVSVDPLTGTARRVVEGAPAKMTSFGAFPHVLPVGPQTDYGE